jgi:hypothetical protein
MANSYIEYTSGLTATTYSVPFNFLSITDVNVKGYNGTTWSDLTVSSRDASAKTVTLDGAPSAYQKIRVWRNTGTTQLVDFQNGSRLSESDLDTAYQQGLFVAQEVSENASTNIEGIGPQGPQGIQGVAGADGVDGVTSTVALTESFESSEQALTDGAMSIEVAHGLGSVPKVFKVVARCKTSEGGWAVGDELDFHDSPTYSNSTNIGLVTFGALVFPNKSTNAGFNPTPANWKLVFRAFA